MSEAVGIQRLTRRSGLGQAHQAFAPEPTCTQSPRTIGESRQYQPHRRGLPEVASAAAQLGSRGSQLVLLFDQWTCIGLGLQLLGLLVQLGLLFRELLGGFSRRVRDSPSYQKQGEDLRGPTKSSAFPQRLQAPLPQLIRKPGLYSLAAQA